MFPLLLGLLKRALKSDCSVCVKGTGILARTRVSSNIPSVKRILLRRSGTVQILRRRSHMGASFHGYENASNAHAWALGLAGLAGAPGFSFLLLLVFSYTLTGMISTAPPPASIFARAL